jgi:hypothetical protein
MSRLHIEKTFEITGIRRGKAKDLKSVILTGRLEDQRLDKSDGLEVQGLEIHIHTNDGQSPYPLGHRLKIIVVD